MKKFVACLSLKVGILKIKRLKDKKTFSLPLDLLHSQHPFEDKTIQPLKDEFTSTEHNKAPRIKNARNGGLDKKYHEVSLLSLLQKTEKY